MKIIDRFWLVAPVFAGIILFSVLFTTMYNQEKNTVHFDCRQLIGGWHPDIPKQIVDECRHKSSPN